MCRYLKVMDRIMVVVLFADKNISNKIVAYETKEEFKWIVPEQDGGDVIADGTHCPVQHPSERIVRRIIYSGKKRRFTYNTTVYVNTNGAIIWMSRNSGIHRRHHATQGESNTVW